MTLVDAINAVCAAYNEDDAEREAILELLVPVLVDDQALASLIGKHWSERADEIRAAITQYQTERAEIDTEAARG